MARGVSDLADVSLGDVARVGPKAAHLGDMLAAGFRIPRGFCVPLELQRRHLQESGLEARIASHLRAVSPSDGTAVARAAAEVRAWIEAEPIGDALSREIVSAYERMGQGAVAVRSSGLAEDLAGASFAGQHDSFLDVVGSDALLRHVRAVWASAWSDRAIAYRAARGLELHAAGVACVVQRMVPAEWAGVLFTADPVTGERDRIVVNAVRGLGEALVSGRATADMWTLRAGDRVVIATRPAGLPAPPWLAELAGIGLALQERFGGPQDVEWAVAEGVVHVVQCRPATALPPEPVSLAAARRPILLFPERVREMAPSAVTPLTADWALEVVVPSIGEAMMRQRLLPRSLAAALTAPVCRNVDGAVYLDLTGLTRFVRGLDEIALADLLDLGTLPPLKAIRPWLVWRMLPMLPGHLRLLRQLPRLGALGEEMVEWMRALLVPYESADLASWTTRELVGFVRLAHPAALHEALVDMPQANAIARGMGAPVQALLERLARAAGEPPGTAGVLTSGLTGLAEVECAGMLWDLAQRAREVPPLRAAFEADPLRAAEVAAADPAAAGWRAAWQEFLRRHGHRTVFEPELARPRWNEDPSWPLLAIAAYLRCPPESSPRAAAERQRERREAAESRIRARLRRRPLRRWMFDRVLSIAQDAAIVSENTKAEIVRLMEVVRRALLELGRRLVSDGRLDASEDVFMLRLAELDGSREGLRETVAARRAAYQAQQKRALPRFVDADGRPVREGLAVPHGADGVLTGIGTSPGRARGPARIVREAADAAALAHGDVLVAPFTDPGWTALFVPAAAVVVETGSLLSHASIVAREMGIPCVVGIPGVLDALRDGVSVEVDGAAGTVRVV